MKENNEVEHNDSAYPWTADDKKRLVKRIIEQHGAECDQENACTLQFIFHHMNWPTTPLVRGEHKGYGLAMSVWEELESSF